VKGRKKVSSKATSLGRKIANRNATKVAVSKVDQYRSELDVLLQQIARRASAGDAAFTVTLWGVFNWIAGIIAILADQDASALDKLRLSNVTVRCLHMLKVALDRSDEGALRIAFGMTKVGCDLLKHTAAREVEFVASFAQSSPTWPVMMATKAIYHQAADKYLQSIRLGTKSVPPTTKSTHVNTRNIRSSELAAMILNKIRLYRYRLFLERDDKGITWPKGSLRTAEQMLRDEAEESRPELLELKNNNTPLELWKIGKRMLYSYWDRNPKQAREDIKLLSGGRGKRDGKSERTLAMELVRRAFYTAVKLADWRI
jgi:hypothetical protein